MVQRGEVQLWAQRWMVVMDQALVVVDLLEGAPSQSLEEAGCVVVGLVVVGPVVGGSVTATVVALQRYSCEA